jgi:hippurate hydrolase
MENQHLKQKMELILGDMISWRHDFHQHPELAFEEKRTSAIISEKLKRFGIKVYKKIGKTGVIGELKAGDSNRSIALRAEMDALPIKEKNNIIYASKNKNIMHACGHDGHMAMLLGAVKYLSETKQFNGTVYFIFQPAEENGGGARAMINDGILKKFYFEKIFAIHNAPSIEAGVFSINHGSVLASQDLFEIQIYGKKSHAAFPHKSIDTIPIAAEVILAIQNIISRKLDPLEKAVISVTQVHSGNATNIISDTACISGSIRCFSKKNRKFITSQIAWISKNIARAHKASCRSSFSSKSLPVINSKKETSEAINTALKIVGEKNLITDNQPVLASDDFAHFLQEKEGCYISLGSGQKTQVHTSHYNFNDKILTIGASFWAQLVEDIL